MQKLSSLGDRIRFLEKKSGIDIVERLRDKKDIHVLWPFRMKEAADEIERLRVDNKRLQAALIKAAELGDTDDRHR